MEICKPLKIFSRVLFPGNISQAFRENKDIFIHAKTQTFYLPYILRKLVEVIFHHIKEETKKKKDMVQETERESNAEEREWGFPRYRLGGRSKQPEAEEWKVSGRLAPKN